MANIIGDIITYFAMTIMGILVILHAINSFTRKINMKILLMNLP